MQDDVTIIPSPKISAGCGAETNWLKVCCHALIKRHQLQYREDISVRLPLRVFLSTALCRFGETYEIVFIMLIG